MTNEQIETQETVETETEALEDQEQMQMPEMRCEDVLRYSISLFSEIAWVKLGIRASPGQGDTTMDLPQAQLAIDAIAALSQLTEGRFDPHEVRDIKNLLSGLQMNFVQRKAAQPS